MSLSSVVPHPAIPYLTVDVAYVRSTSHDIHYFNVQQLKRNASLDVALSMGWGEERTTDKGEGKAWRGRRSEKKGDGEEEELRKSVEGWWGIGREKRGGGEDRTEKRE